MKRKGSMLARLRTRLDFNRIAAGMSRPGIDSRSWLALARVDEDPDAIVWDRELGWLVDVTMVGGGLDGEGPVLCRQPSAGQGPGVGEYHPPRAGCLVIVLVPNGDPNNDCLIVGQLNDEGCAAATAINGVDITEAFAARTHIMAFPAEDLDAEFEHVRLTGDMTLGVAGADQPYARGDDLAGAVDDFADALIKFLNTAAAVPGGFGEVTATGFNAAGGVLKAKALAFKAARSRWLSTRIRGT